MCGNLHGIIAFLVFSGMSIFSVLMIVIALIVRVTGNKNVFAKLAMVSFVFFIISAGGFGLVFLYDGSNMAKTMDDTICWVLLCLAIIVSVMVMFRKKKTPVVT